MAATAAPAAKPKRMSLAQVSRGKIDKPYRIVMYGIDGVGKSSWAAAAPSPIFIDGEDGTGQLDVARFPKPEKWADVLDAITELGTQQHSYETLVVDTLDWLEPLCFERVCEDGGEKSIEDFGFGKGYKQAQELWHGLFAYLERLQAKTGMNVILLAHCQIRTFKNPRGEDFDRYEMKLNAKLAGLTREWPDEVLFVDHQTLTYEKDKRVRGISDGARIIHTTRDAAFDAKNRHDLPAELPLSWEDFDAACKAGGPASADDITAAIEGLLAGADETLAEKVQGAVKAANGNAGKLAQVLDRLKSKIGNSSNNDGESK